MHGRKHVSLQVRDLERSAAFYERYLGLKRSDAGPPHAVVFGTKPIAFAVRDAAAGTDLDAIAERGHHTGRVSCPDQRFILPIRHVADPEKPVFYLPADADPGRQGRGTGVAAAGNEVRDPGGLPALPRDRAADLRDPGGAGEPAGMCVPPLFRIPSGWDAMKPARHHGSRPRRSPTVAYRARKGQKEGDRMRQDETDRTAAVFYIRKEDGMNVFRCQI